MHTKVDFCGANTKVDPIILKVTACNIHKIFPNGVKQFTHCWWSLFFYTCIHFCLHWLKSEIYIILPLQSKQNILFVTIGNNNNNNTNKTINTNTSHVNVLLCELYYIQTPWICLCISLLAVCFPNASHIRGVVSQSRRRCLLFLFIPTTVCSLSMPCLNSKRFCAKINFSLRSHLCLVHRVHEYECVCVNVANQRLICTRNG